MLLQPLDNETSPAQVGPEPCWTVTRKLRSLAKNVALNITAVGLF